LVVQATLNQKPLDFPSCFVFVDLISYVIIAAISNVTMFRILIIGLIAGPAVLLAYGVIICGELVLFDEDSFEWLERVQFVERQNGTAVLFDIYTAVG